MPEAPVTDSKHFDLHPLVEGVFAAVARDGGSAICNSGVIDLGGRTLIFDTFLTPQAAVDLRRTISGVIGPAPAIVVNSHYHNDHIWGNQVYAPDAQIVSSRRTRALIATAGAEELAWYTSNAAQQLESLRARCTTENDEQRKHSLLWTGYYEGLVEALPHLTVSMPSVTFDDHLGIHGSRYTVDLIAHQGAHTEHDTVLHLPEVGVVFAGDLLFVGCHPFLADGDPFRLVKALRELSHLRATWFLPGHGSVGTVDDVELLIAYIEHCVETARGLVDRGHASESWFAELEIDGRFAHWRVPRFYEANIRFLCRRMGSAAGNG